MNKNRIIAIGIIGILLCSGTITVSACTTALIAGQEEIDGSVEITRTGKILHITYTVGSGWTLTEMHLAVGASLDDIPTNKKGNPKIGLFPYFYCPTEETTSHTFDVNLADYFEDGVYEDVDVYFAAHAVVTHPEYGEETAWADTYGVRFTENNWALYFVIQMGFAI